MLSSFFKSSGTSFFSVTSVTAGVFSDGAFSAVEGFFSATAGVFSDGFFSSVFFSVSAFLIFSFFGSVLESELDFATSFLG